MFRIPQGWGSAHLGASVVQKAFWVMQMMILLLILLFSLIWNWEKRYFPSLDKYSIGQGCAISSL